ncbi:MAG: hypothetical protein COA79_21100 [Planctomycetota bacterium]|nr:MAG: hypothetical protein COA79_21100 [Planctomycetota bacterium]
MAKNFKAISKSLKGITDSNLRNPIKEYTIKSQINTLMEKVNLEWELKNYETSLNYLKDSWNLLPSPKTDFDDSYHIVELIISLYLENLNLPLEAKNWVKIFYECDTARIDSGERHFVDGKTEYALGNIESSMILFSKAYKLSEGRCFIDEDPKFKTLYFKNKGEEPVKIDNTEIEILWCKYKNWLKNSNPDWVNLLNSGASADDLKVVEDQLSFPLPNDYKDFLKIHDGQRQDSIGLLSENIIFGIIPALGCWESMKHMYDGGQFNNDLDSEPKGAIQYKLWNVRWFPISNDNGNLVCIDLDPGPNGKVGQIIDFDNSSVHRVVLADSFLEYFQEYIDDIINKKYIYSDEYGALMHKDNL